jgi:hypothetical protein
MAILETKALTRCFDGHTAVDALRALMLTGGTSVIGLGPDLGVLLMVTAVLVIIGGWMYPRIAI